MGAFMAFLRTAAILILILAATSVVYTQTQTTAPTAEDRAAKQAAAEELEKNALEMLDQVSGGVALLKLPENRAFIYASIGDLIWKADEKQARKLFRDAANEIVMANNTPREVSETQSLMEMNIGRPEINNLRRMVLQTIAMRDGELALELLPVTRPADIALELQNYVPPVTSATQAPGPAAPMIVSSGGLFSGGVGNIKAAQEIQLEQSLIRRAAEQNPERAVKLIRESLAKGITPEIMGLLQKVAVKDAKLANTLLGEVVQKLMEFDYSKSRQEMNAAISFLKIYGIPQAVSTASPAGKNAPALKIEDGAARSLAVKIADSLMRMTNGNDPAFSTALPILEKLAPEKVALIKQKQAALKNQKPATAASGPRSPQSQTPASLLDMNATPEMLVADAGKAQQANMRRSLYQRTANLAGADFEKVRSLLQSAPQSKERDDAVTVVNARMAQKALRDGKLDEVRKVIDQMPAGNQKVEQIVDLAIASYRQNSKESKENAAQLMIDATQMVNSFPDNRDEIDGLLKVISGFATIEPDRAFSMLPAVIEKVNEVSQASAILARYNKQTTSFRDGEMLMVSGLNSSGVRFARFGREIKALSQTDFGRTRSLIDQFNRDDVRLFAKLFVAQSILKQQIGLEGGGF
jgi:hypothetical protein